MKTWDNHDIGKILLYRKVGGVRENERVVICKICPENSGLIGVLDYPIALNSRFAVLGLVKDQEKKEEDYFREAGDWIYEGKVTSEEKGILEKISKTPKCISDIC
jgi:hypothetical protein